MARDEPHETNDKKAFPDILRVIAGPLGGEAK